MKIQIKTEDFHVKIPIPGFLVYNRISIAIGLHYVQKHYPLTKKQVIQLKKLAKKIKVYRGLCIVAIETKDGECVKITL